LIFFFDSELMLDRFSLVASYLKSSGYVAPSSRYSRYYEYQQ